jgi:hypothetical protein
MKRSAWVAVAGTAVTVGMLAAKRFWGRSSNVGATPESSPAHPEPILTGEPVPPSSTTTKPLEPPSSGR